MKHTPGPWTVEADSEDPQTLNIRSGSVPFVASVWGDGGTSFEQSANARLITAAPELLARLQECVSQLERMDARLLRLTDSPYECELGEITRARAAIAKAGG